MSPCVENLFDTSWSIPAGMRLPFHISFAMDALNVGDVAQTRGNSESSRARQSSSWRRQRQLQSTPTLVEYCAYIFYLPLWHVGPILCFSDFQHTISKMQWTSPLPVDPAANSHPYSPTEMWGKYARLISIMILVVIAETFVYSTYFYRWVGSQWPRSI